MFERFRDYIYYLLPSFLKRVRKSVNQWWIFTKVVGDWFDECLDDMERARDETTIATCSDTMLRYHGEDRGLVQYSGESYDTFRGRIAMYDEVMRMGGTSEGIILAVNALGYEDVEHVWAPELTGDYDRWAEFYILIHEDIANPVPTALENVIREVRFWKEPEALDNYRRDFLAQIETRITSEALYAMLTVTMFFPGGRKLDGSKLLDGSKYLDGSAGNAEALVDYMADSRADLDVVVSMFADYRAECSVQPAADAGHDTEGQTAFFNHARRLDGSRLLDGSRTLTGTVGLVEMMIDSLAQAGTNQGTAAFTDYRADQAAHANTETVQAMDGITKFWIRKTLDGRKKLDGTQLLDQQTGWAEMSIGNN